jgi:hypothetical protein
VPALVQAFEHVRVVAVDGLAAALAEQPAEQPAECVVFTGLAATEAADAVRLLLAQQTLSAPVVLDCTDSGLIAGLSQDPTALAGMAVAGVAELGGVHCAVLERDARSVAPDLTVLGELAARAGEDRRTAEARAALAVATATELQRRLDIAERERDTMARQVSELRDAKRTHRPAAAAASRLMSAVGASTYLLLAVGVAVLLAVLTSTGYVGGLLTATVLVGAPVAAYLVRGQRRTGALLVRARVDLGTLRTAQRELGKLDKDRTRELARSIRAVETHLEVVEATVVDLARRAGPPLV